MAVVHKRLTAGRTGRLMKIAACLASSTIATVFLVHSYGAAQVVTASKTAHPWTLLGAVALGVAIQIVRAQRSRWLLAQHGPVALSHSFAAMVVGHGIGDLVPVAPGGPVLRSALTERLAGVPIAFSGGAYMIEGTLDVIAPAFLVPYVLLTLSLPRWTHWVLVGIIIQASLFLIVLAVLALRSPVSLARRLPACLSPRLVRLAGEVAGGLRAVTVGGPRRCLLICGVSLLLLPLTAMQVLLFLHAFGLRASVGGLVLLLVVMLSAGSLPFKVPAFGTISAAAVLPIAGIQGPAAGGYLLVSQFLLSSQTVVLALLVLAWWLIRGIRPVGSLVSGGNRRRWSLGDLLLLGSPRPVAPVYVKAGQPDGADMIV